MRIYKRIIDKTAVSAYNDSGAEWVVTVGSHTERFSQRAFTMNSAMRFMVDVWGEREIFSKERLDDLAILEAFFAKLFLTTFGDKVRVNLDVVEGFLLANIQDNKKYFPNVRLMTEKLGDIVEFSIEVPARKLLKLNAIDAADIIENMDDLRTLQAFLIEDAFSK